MMRIYAYLYSQPFFIHQLIRICQHENSLWHSYYSAVEIVEEIRKISIVCTDVARKSIESYLIIPENYYCLRNETDICTQ